MNQKTKRPTLFIVFQFFCSILILATSTYDIIFHANNEIRGYLLFLAGLILTISNGAVVFARLRDNYARELRE